MTTTAAAPQAVAASPAATGAVDIVLRAGITLRLVGATVADRRAVERQFGPAGPASTRPADITITYVERLAGADGERLLGAREYAFDDAHFVVVRGRHKEPVRVRLPMGAIGGPCEVVCEHGVGRVPLLVAIVNLTLGSRGAVAVHGSAFTLGGRGVLTMGWSKGGKTEALLAALARGGGHVGDEWVHLHDGDQMSGIVEPMRIWHSHLRTLPGLRRRVPPVDRARIAALAAAGNLDRLASPRLRRLGALAGSRCFVDLGPERVAARSEALVPRTARVDVVLLVTSASVPGIEVRPIGAEEVADRMAASLAAERAPLEAAYHAWRFAFPARVNDAVRTADEREHAALRRFLAGTEALEVRHPYPVDLADLGPVLERIVEEST